MTPSDVTRIRFVVSSAPISGEPRPIVGVDGPVAGADFLYDHHASGEPVNLLAIPDDPPTPATLATTMLDGDAIISAAVVVLRAGGRHDALARAWPVLYEAAHWCDHLIPNGDFGHLPADAGLGLHCWLKSRGFALRTRLARAGNAPAASAQQASGRAFQLLTGRLTDAIRQGVLPTDTRYLRRLEGMARHACASLQGSVGNVSIVRPQSYIDPLALYRAIDTDLCIRIHRLPTGATGYALGVHPRAYGRLDLRPALAWLNTREPGWGGRSNAGGSPVGGSHLDLETVLAALRRSDRTQAGG